MDDTDYESFEIMMQDFDEGVPSPYDGETDADVLEYVSSFFGCFFTEQPNGFNPFDYDENPDPSVLFSWYLGLLTHGLQFDRNADNWFGMGPITIPNEGAALSFITEAVSQWKDGFDVIYY